MTFHKTLNLDLTEASFELLQSICSKIAKINKFKALKYSKLFHYQQNGFISSNDFFITVGNAISAVKVVPTTNAIIPPQY